METKMTDGTGRALLDWLDRAAEKGWLNKNTAAGYKAACQRILEVESGWEQVDLSTLDANSIIQRFVNLKGGDYSPKSLETYKSRFRKAVETYLDWAEDPSTWKLPAPSRVKRDTRASSSSDSQLENKAETTRLVALQPHVDEEMITYPFPLRKNVAAQLVLPRDLNGEEAKRLSAFINALAFDELRRD